MTAAILVAVIFFLLATLPPRSVTLSLEGADPSLAGRTARGAYHIHTKRSDGAEDKAAVAAAAARAGLTFAIFTEHGDGTTVPDPPAYVHGVLCVDGVEISTNGGHYVALDMAVAPYPLGGEAAAVVEDVARLGGFGVAAHPDHPKQALAWTDWKAPIDGLEWLNADAAWRDDKAVHLARVLFDYLLRPAPAIASTLDRPTRTLDRWAALGQSRPVVGLAAADAHGGARARDEDGGGTLIGGPSYESTFRTFSNSVVLDRPFAGDAAGDSRLLLEAVRRGHVYTVIDAIAGPAIIAVRAQAASSQGGAHVPLTIGDRATIGPAASFDVDVTGNFGERPMRRVPGTSAPQLVAPARRDEPLSEGAHFFEVAAHGAPGQPPIPWILTNPIYFLRKGERPTEDLHFVASEAVHAAWRMETDGRSRASIAAGPQATVSYQLAPGPRASQFVALVTDLRNPGPGFTHLLFKGSASRPMRVSVQLRFPPDDRRWRKSVYLDTRPREVAVAVSDMVPADDPSANAPSAGLARSLMFVVDLVNARPGDGGEFAVADVRIAKR